MHPAMLLTILSGAALAYLNPLLLRQGWLHAKLVAVVLLVAYQLYAGVVRRRFASKRYVLSERACRALNEVPTVLLLAISILVVVRPF
jgi:putative membrane protein